MWIIAIICILFIVLFYKKLIVPLNYWNERNIVNEKGWPLVGSFGEFVLRKTHFTDIFDRIYKNHPNERYVGFNLFARPILLIRDLDLIKQIGVQCFDNFPDHGGVSESRSDPLISKTLLMLRGDHWRKMRATISPAFTSGKMKMMYKFMDECAQNLVHHFETNRTSSVDLKDLFTRYTNDVIATTAFGVKTNSFENPENEFFTTAKDLLNFSAFQTLKAFIMQASPGLAHAFRMKLFEKKITNFFHSIIIDTIKMREKNNIIRPDLIHLLMEAKKGQLKTEDIKHDEDTGFATVEESEIGKSGSKVKLDDEAIVAQTFIFFFGGFEPGSTLSCFLAQELAMKPHCQKKLQEEIDEVISKHHGQLPYEVLFSMKYLDQVISETLRLWPTNYLTDRLCDRNFTIEPKLPQEKTLVVEKGTQVFIPIKALQRDAQYYPNPNNFDPERFNVQNKSKIISGAYLPFGIGPRNCIGSRFVLLQVKILFYHLLSKFDLVATEKTTIPWSFDPSKFNLVPVNGFWLALRPRKLTGL